MPSLSSSSSKATKETDDLSRASSQPLGRWKKYVDDRPDDELTSEGGGSHRRSVRGDIDKIFAKIRHVDRLAGSSPSIISPIPQTRHALFMCIDQFKNENIHRKQFFTAVGITGGWRCQWLVKMNLELHGAKKCKAHYNTEELRVQ